MLLHTLVVVPMQQEATENGMTDSLWGLGWALGQLYEDEGDLTWQSNQRLSQGKNDRNPAENVHSYGTLLRIPSARTALLGRLANDPSWASETARYLKGSIGNFLFCCSSSRRLKSSVLHMILDSAFLKLGEDHWEASSWGFFLREGRKSLV